MTVQQLETQVGKTIKDVKVFEVEGTFNSKYAAEKWLHDNGYSYGSSERENPIAVMKGEYELPQKWSNISKMGKEVVDAVIVSDDFREGSVSVIIFSNESNF